MCASVRPEQGVGLTRFRMWRVAIPSATVLAVVCVPLSQAAPQVHHWSQSHRAAMGAPQGLAAKTSAGLARLSVAFEPNVGQAELGVDYVAHLNGYTALLSKKGLALSLSGV